MCTDGEKWFIYNDERGMTRGNKVPKTGEWSCEKQVSDPTYRGMTMFCHLGQLLVRHDHADVSDVAFIEVDKETLKPVADAQHYKSDEDSEGSLKWTPMSTEY